MDILRLTERFDGVIDTVIDGYVRPQAILIPAMIIRRARTLTVRIIGYHRSLDRFFSAYNTIERTRFG